MKNAGFARFLNYLAGASTIGNNAILALFFNRLSNEVSSSLVEIYIRKTLAFFLQDYLAGARTIC